MTTIEESHVRQLSQPLSGAPELDVELGWSLLLVLARRAQAGAPVAKIAGFRLLGQTWLEVSAEQARIVIDPRAPSGFRSSLSMSSQVRSMLELYLPLVAGERAAQLTVGHLGQSLDGRIATPTGASQFITSREDVVHTHRMRALFDAVVVGVQTVLVDNPQLTTRLVPGAHPTRVVLDPRARLSGAHKVLCDGAAPTLICTDEERLSSDGERVGQAERVGVKCAGDGFDPASLLEALRARGLRRVFVEGGGITVSKFLAMGVLDRLQVTVAPMILGSGAPAFQLPPIDQLSEAITPRCRQFVLGTDVMFDCELSPREASTHV